VSAVYLESSALLACLLVEDGAEEITSRLDEPGAVVTSSLTLVARR